MRQPPSAATPHRGATVRSNGAADAAAHAWPPDDGVLSDVWSVFQQLMLEVPTEQPVVVLATTHCGWLPPVLLHWFDHPQVCSAGSKPAGRICGAPSTSKRGRRCLQSHR